MAFSSISQTNHQDMDRALENMGFSYLDDVPFCVDPRLAEANVDLSRAEALLARPAPSVSGLSSIDLAELGRLEKQFLEHLAKLDADAKAKLDKEEKEIAEYRERKQKEDEERKREEAERKAEEEEKERQLQEQREQQQQQQETEEKQLSEKLEREAKLEKEEASPKREFLTPKTSPDESAKMAAFLSKPIPANFNYSDFEAESDPFERAELQTLDDLGILATVLQTTSPVISGSTTAPSFATASSAQTTTPTQSGAMAIQQPGMFFGGQHFYSQMNYQMPHYPAMPYPNPSSIPHQMMASNWPTQSVVTTAQSTTTPALKSSKSYGDILAEMKKEDSATADSSLFGQRDIRKLSSQTPPPRPVPFRQPSSSVTNNSALDWIPWPDLDGTDTLKRRGSSPTKSSSTDSTKILGGLSATSAATCRMISDMGFPLARVAKVCRALGDDQQQIINYCLLVDKFVEGEKFAVDAVEQALLLHTVDETKTRKHLQVFRQLSEFGFESSKIHNALMSCDLEYEKTLENLLK